MSAAGPGWCCYGSALAENRIRRLSEHLQSLRDSAEAKEAEMVSGGLGVIVIVLVLFFAGALAP